MQFLLHRKFAKRFFLWYNADTLTEFKAICAVRKGAVRHKECCPKSSFLCGLNGRITVVYHRIVVAYSNSATDVEIVKKRFRRGFYCCTIFHIKSIKN